MTFGATGFGVIYFLFYISCTHLKDASQLEIDRKTFEYQQDLAHLEKLEESNAEKQALLDLKQNQLDQLTRMLDSVLGNKEAFEAASESGDVDVDAAMATTNDISRLLYEIEKSDRKIKEATKLKEVEIHNEEGRTRRLKSPSQ